MHLCAVYCQSPYVYPRQDCGEDSVINMSVSRRKGGKAWVLYWEVQPGGPAPIARDHEVVAVLPPNWGEDRVQDVLERLYLEQAMTPSEMLSWRNRGSSPYPPKCGAYVHHIQVTDLEFFCGHNPILKARKVEQLVTVNECELAWKEVGVAHLSAALCEAAGQKNCPLVGKEPDVTDKRGFGSRLPADELEG
jgi:hypothetical protein